ncbi:unnamed protein product [Rotaria sordida]|uniref:TRPM SLOG domain-containing protein n=1 Tax=Rotaria sordida TaxID=392033 RepID=A0A815BKW4_9BILA|nr:unnamed protein product [Rotaria sordida]
MFASTTQQSLINTNDDPIGETKSNDTIYRTFSTSNPVVYNAYIQQQYGACWGTFEFEDCPSSYINNPRPFLYVDGNIPLGDIRRFMINEWHMQTANIIIPVLSNVTNYKPFKNTKTIEALKRGIKNIVNASEVWFITNGIDIGVPQLIGSAFREEIALRRAYDIWDTQLGREPKKRKRLILIGIVCDDVIIDAIDLRPGINKSKMEVKVPTRKRGNLSLNSDHTHFIIIREKAIGSASMNVGQNSAAADSDERQFEKLADSADSATNRFRERFENSLHQEALQQQATVSPNLFSPITDGAATTSPSSAHESNGCNEGGFPMVCTFVRGTPGTIKLLHTKIREEIPVVIFKGTGSVADIIAFAYEEFHAKSDKEFEDSYLKVELTQRLLNEYPALIDNHAVLGKNLETFVDIFLDNEFIPHRYLTSDELFNLFKNAKDRKFLKQTSWKGILGIAGDDEEIPQNFIDHHLNIIMKRLTGISGFFRPYEMDCNAVGIYFCDKTDKDIQQHRLKAEKKAIRYLIIYAVLMNRHQLAKIFWKHSLEPIPMALICYMMFKKLAIYCHDPTQRLRIEKQAKEFSDYAVGVLEKSFNEDQERTLAMLDDKNSDWNHMTTFELAYRADNRAFMVHPAYQKLVTQRFYDEITVRELSWGLFKCPDYLKIIISACLIFPMQFWISFSSIDQSPPTSKKANDMQKGKKLETYASEASVRNGDSLFRRPMSCFRRNDKLKNTIQQIKTLWNAPITKFYMNFVAYLVYLSFFTLAVMWPSCGNLWLDCFVWLWTASIAFENTRVAYVKFYSQNRLPLQRDIPDVIVQIIFLALYLSFRILGLWNFGTCRILTAKAIMGIGLIYYYYRILFVYFPVSSTLGPMMIRLRSMIMNDFFTFLQLFVIFMISSGVAITAVLYPHYPLGLDLFTKAFVFRGLMALFTTDMADLKNPHQSCSINVTSGIDRKYACLRLSHGPSFKYDRLSTYNRYGISSPECNQTSWIAWFLLIQYFFLAKRFLISLLTAMFSLTGARIQSQSEKIWMYNRYEIMIEYTKRPRLPPPLIVISYIGMLISKAGQCMFKWKEYLDKKSTQQARLQLSSHNVGGDSGYGASSATPLAVDMSNTSNNVNLNTDDLIDDSSSVSIENRSLVGRLLNCKPCRQMINHEKTKNQNAELHWVDNETSFYWEYKAKEFFAKTVETEKVQERLENLSKSVTDGKQDMNAVRKSLRQINDRIFSLEKMVTDSHILLEKLHATIYQKDKPLPKSQKYSHVLSRESPYIYTNEARFSVTEKYIPWTRQFDLYDPTLITLPKEHICFQDDERSFVEPNLLRLSSMRDELQPALDTIIEPSLMSLSSNDFIIPASEYKWNQVVELQLPDGKKMVIDRTTWVANPDEETSVTYRLDTQLFLPLNPIGRTGVRGRGALIRWGPNKSTIAIITRWKKHRDQCTLVDGTRILEAMPIHCQYFKSFARSDNNDDDQQNGFEAHMVYRGYIDDARNTDNAWVEAEIWNFHYGSNMSFPRLRNDSLVAWKDVTCNSRGFPVQMSILREISRIHHSYFDPFFDFPNLIGYAKHEDSSNIDNIVATSNHDED